MPLSFCTAFGRVCPDSPGCRLHRVAIGAMSWDTTGARLSAEAIGRAQADASLVYAPPAGAAATPRRAYAGWAALQAVPTVGRLRSFG